MKKTLALVLVLCLMWSLAACNPEAPILKIEVTWPPVQQPEESTGESTSPDQTKPMPTDPVDVTDPSGPSQSEQTGDTTGSQQTDPPTEPSQPATGYTRAELEAMDTTKNGWGLGPYTDDKGRPVDATRAQEQYGQYEAYYIYPDDGNFYLTFDEGYENGYTPQILDVLKEKNVKAVFFVTMQYVKEEPELVQRMIDEGHVVGNHSVRHKSMPTLSIDEMISEVMDLHNYMLENFNYEMDLFRPPMGEFSQQSLAVLQDLGYKSVLWSFAYKDYDVNAQPNPDTALEKIVSTAHSGEICLLHAVSATNTAVLGDVIDQIRERGLTFALM